MTERQRGAQLPLELRLESLAQFDTFVAGGNEVACAAVRTVAEQGGVGAIWLHGPAGAGKSHLLQAACRETDRCGRSAMYIPLAEAESVAADILLRLESLDLVAIDDVGTVAGKTQWELALFSLFNACLTSGCSLLISADSPPAQAQIAMPDLKSRAAGSVVYRLEPLNGDQRSEALIRHAQWRGLKIDDAAATYLLNRIPRDMKAVVEWLDFLDRASLAEQRRLTIPLIRQAMTDQGAAAIAATQRARRKPMPK